MLSRRQFTHLSLAGAALAVSPRTLAQSAEIVLWGPPVAPTILLSIAAGQQVMQQNYPGIHAKTWRGPDMLRAGLANRTMPLVMVPSYVAANFRNRGQDVGLLNIMTFGLLYIVGKDDKVRSLEDLAGKKLVMPFKQDMPDLVLKALMQKAGMDETKVQIQYTGTPPEAMQLLLAGKADLALLPEPAATAATLKGKAQGIDRRLNIQQLWGDYMGGKPRIPQAGLLATRDFYEKNAGFLALLQEPLHTALKLAQSDPKQAAQQGAEVLGMPVPVTAASIPHAHLAVTDAADIQDEILSFFEVLYRLNPKILGGKPADASLFWKIPAQA